MLLQSINNNQWRESTFNILTICELKTLCGYLCVHVYDQRVYTFTSVRCALTYILCYCFRAAVFSLCFSFCYSGVCQMLVLWLYVACLFCHFKIRCALFCFVFLNMLCASFQMFFVIVISPFFFSPFIIMFLFGVYLLFVAF